MEESKIHRIYKERQVLVVTGLSGAGKNIVMRTLEDLDFYCVDNLPVPLLGSFLDFAFQAKTNLSKVALGIDARGKQFLHDFIHEITKLKRRDISLFDCKIIFLNSSDEVLLKRFQETRRPHPLGRGKATMTAIRKEKTLLSPLMDLADVIIDTDSSNIHELRRLIRHSIQKHKRREIIVNLVSFGFKYGLPAESNLVYDVRFLPNPYFVSKLKMLTGKDPTVQAYLLSQKMVVDYWQQLSRFLHYSLAKYCEEGRFSIQVAIGCTGGQHRSVFFVEQLAQQQWDKVRFSVHHRDIHKDRHLMRFEEFQCAECDGPGFE